MAGIARSHTSYRKKLLRNQSAPKEIFGAMPEKRGGAQLRRGAKERAELLWMLKEVALSPIAFVLGFAGLLAGRVIGFKLLAAGGMYPLSPGTQKWLPLIEVVLGVALAMGIALLIGMNKGIRRIALIGGLAAAFWFEPAYIGKIQAEYEGHYPYQTLRAQILGG
ncbi:MAG: hypothetical protein GKR99_19495 [Rhodobacteraceae bacterium]|nr:hypothetical protein [Paracoccaceae bacterium]